jgi:hypothetical protein
VLTPPLTHGPRPVRNAALGGKSPKKRIGAKPVGAADAKDVKVEKANALKKDAKSTTSN